MKFKNLLLSLSLVASFAVYAASISQAELDKVNAYIATILEQDGDSEDIGIKLTSGNRMSNGKLSALAVEVISKDPDEDIKGIGAIDFKDEKVNLELSLSVNANDILESDDFDMMIQYAGAFVQEYVAAINKLGIYNATFTLSTTNSGVEAFLKVLPGSSEAESLNFLTLSLKVNKKTKTASIAFETNMNSEAVLVSKAQGALTNIFEDLLTGKGPSESDYEVIEDLIEEIMNQIEIDN